MIEFIKERYQQIKEGGPGSRFRNFYNLRHEKTQGSPLHNRIYTAAGIFLIVIGLLLAVSPLLPGLVIALIGVSMLAARSCSFATFFDAFELSVRCVLTRNCPVP